jgi:hypothetical protein
MVCPVTPLLSANVEFSFVRSCLAFIEMEFVHYLVSSV